MSVVREFHAVFGQPAPTSPPLQVDVDLVRLRMRLIQEETKEVMDELAALTKPMTPEKQRPLLAALLKELADLRYVVEGCAVSLGLPIDEAFYEVHRSNMSKLGPDGLPIKDSGGKVLKGPDYRPANMEQFVPHVITIKPEEA